MHSKRTQVDLRSARQEFATRYNRWAFVDARREVREDFHFVRRVQSQIVYRFLEMVDGMDSEMRLRLMTALVKRFHKIGPAQVCDVETREDENLIRQYLEYDHGEIMPGLMAALPVIRNGRSKRMRMEGEGFKLAKIDRKALHDAIVKKLTVVCGPRLKGYNSGESYFETAVASWIMRTEFSTNARFRHFDYFHRLMTPNGNIVGQGMSLLQWLGMSGETCWQLEGESQVQSAVDALGDLVAHFLREAAVFLEDFAPPQAL